MMMAPSTPRSTTNKKRTNKATGGESQFPGRLHNLMDYVEQQGIDGVISWVLNGRGFQVHDPDRLVELLPLFFSQTKYRSFCRQLNMWHFERVEKGPCKGAFIHPYFVRGNRELALSMCRQLYLKPRRENSFSSTNTSVATASTTRSQEQDECNSKQQNDASFNNMKFQQNQEENPFKQDEQQDDERFVPIVISSSTTRTTTGTCFRTDEDDVLLLVKPEPTHQSDFAAYHQKEPLPRTRNLQPVKCCFVANDYLGKQWLNSTSYIGFEHDSDLGLFHDHAKTRKNLDAERAIPNFIQRQAYLSLEPLPFSNDEESGCYMHEHMQQQQLVDPLEDLLGFEEDIMLDADDLLGDMSAARDFFTNHSLLHNSW